MNTLQLSRRKLAVIILLCIIILIFKFSTRGTASAMAADDIAPPLDQSISYHTNILAIESAVNSRITTYDCAATSEIPQPECVALVALYENTNGSNWTTKADWLTTNTPCSWFGVTCIDNRVSELNLANNALSGMLPPELGNLTKLERLSLFRNQITGPIPSSLGNMSSLNTIFLHSNQLSGELPAELGNLSNLDALFLFGNELTGCIPTELGNLKEKLRHIHLYSNKLGCTIPSSLGNLTNLLTLDLGGNELTGAIPPELGNLINLTDLKLSENQLSGPIPVELSKLVSLEILSLHHNELSGTIPSPLVDQPSSLKRVVLQNNLLSGPIPSDLGTLENLGYLYLSDNNLSGSIPPELGNLNSLVELSLARNRLSGSIPPEFGNLANLKALNLATNLLNGSIPSDLGTLENLAHLDLSDNNLSGSIPPEIGNLANLKMLNLATNLLGGVLPPELGNLTKLERLWLFRNKITGPIPSSLGNMSSLNSIFLHSNQLNGEMPAELGNLSKLGALFLYGNELTGCIPTELGNLNEKLRDILLYSNKLGCTIPSSLGNLTNLLTLDLGGNELTGAIPPELGNLINLTGLHLSQNQLSGPIPVELSNMTALSHLRLDNNQLNGHIPPEIGELQNLIRLLLQNNLLSGEVPGKLGNLSNLLWLTLGGNLLSGPLPVDLMNLNLDQLWYDSPDICLPKEPDFMIWLETIPKRLGTNVICSQIVTVTKSVSQYTAKPDDTVQYTIEITPKITTSFTLTEHLPINSTYVKGTVNGGATYDGKSHEIHYSSQVLQRGQIVSITFKTKVNSDVKAGSTLLDITTVTPISGEPVQRSVNVVVADTAQISTLVLIYAVGDNDLSEEMIRLLNNVEKGLASTSSTQVNVEMLFDGPQENDTYLFSLEPDSDLSCPNLTDWDCDGRYTEGKNFQQWPTDDTANPHQLSAFLSQAIRKYPNAEQIIVSLVGHGNGWAPNLLPPQPSHWDPKPDLLGGMLWDNHPNRSMSTKALGQALQWTTDSTGRKIDLLYLDSCSMAMLEVAYELRNSTHYMLASENWSWAAFPYDKHMEAIDGSKDARTVGIDWLQTEARRLATSNGHPYTLSLIDMEQIDELHDAVNQVASLLKDTLPASRATLEQAHREMDCFESNYDTVIDNRDSYCDIKSFATHVQSTLSDPNKLIPEASQHLLTILEKAVIHEAHRNGQPWPPEFKTPWEWQDIGGLSIYLPLNLDYDDCNRRYYTFDHLQFVADGTWGDFLTKFWENTDGVAASECDSRARPLPVDDLPTVEFKMLNYEISESNQHSQAIVEVVIDPLPAEIVTVQYTTSDGTAIAGQDYISSTGTLTFNPIEASKIFTITVKDDPVYESNETVKLSLNSPTNALLGEKSNAILTIQDNDDPPSVSFGTINYSVNEDEVTFDIEVVLSAESANWVTITVSISDTARTLLNNVSSMGKPVTFQPGEIKNSVSLSIPNSGDIIGKTVNLSLSSPINGDLGPIPVINLGIDHRIYLPFISKQP